MSGTPPPALRHLYDDVLAVLLRWSAPNQSQEQLRRSFMATLAQDPSAVAKSGPPAHITASCLVLSADGSRVLLHLHGKAGIWLQFGGHLETTDASVRDAARREATEESGLSGLDPWPDPIDLDRHALGNRFGTCSEHLDIRFLAVVPAGSAPLASDESTDIGWFPVDALPPDVAPDVPRLIAVCRDHLAAAARRG